MLEKAENSQKTESLQLQAFHAYCNKGTLKKIYNKLYLTKI